MSATVAVVGRGFGAAVHAPGWTLAGARVLGIFGQHDWREGIQDADVVSVAAPPAAHFEVALEALRLGKAVLCEKPLATTVAEAEELVSAGGRTAVNFSYRALPAFRRFRELLDSDELEVLWTTSSRLRAHAPSWKDDPYQGGALAAYGVHAIDYARWFFGPARVESARIEGNDDTVAAVLAHERGGRTSLHVSIVASVPVHEVRAGTLDLVAATPNPVEFELRRGHEPVEVEQLPLPDGRDPRVAPFAVHARALLEDTERPTFTDGLQAQRLLDEIRRTAS